MRLVEYYFELFYYTSFLKSLDFSQLPYENVAKRYKQILSKSLQAAKREGLPESEWGAGLFPVAAWIDETVLCSDWPDRRTWRKNPLQLVFYKTMNAGEEFFSRLEALDRSRQEVREVYSYCLALGFKGRYFQPKDGPELDRIVRENMAIITPDGKAEFPDVFFPEAYADASADRGKRPFFWNVRWTAVIGIAVPALVTAALYLFFRAETGNLMRLFSGTGF